MNKRQRWILMNFAIVIAVTIASALGMIEMKNWVNRSEAMRAMEQLGGMVNDYRGKNGSVPPESYIDGLKESLEGQVRLGKIHYRARWMELDSPPAEILAYTVKNYHALFFRPGAVVLRLDGSVQWMEKEQFETLLASQQSPLEIQMTSK